MFLSTSFSKTKRLSFTKVPFHPFEDGEPVTLVILSYQRCGSSFFGNIFGKNPDVFYMFEPLDALYSALYGTNQGWNVPSDITNYKNGTRRFSYDIHTTRDLFREVTNVIT